MKRISKNKPFKMIIAFALVAVLILTGTFAWVVLGDLVNEFNGGGENPGGTTHDDFDEPNKDVYVENWGNTPFYVRIRLDEYMELGQGAGKYIDTDGVLTPDGDNHAESQISYAHIDQRNTWEPHVPSTVASVCDTDADFHHYWTWSMGGGKYYMPATDPDRQNPSFVAQDPAVYDGSEPNVQLTPIAAVITMAQWHALGRPVGQDYWVIDTDGWAYWAQAVPPHSATGLLLDAVYLLNPPEEDYYYAINVVVQMATIDGEHNYLDFGNATDPNDRDHSWTPDGEELMHIITSGTGGNNGNVEDIRNANIGDTVIIDGLEWVKIALEDDHALLMLKNIEPLGLTTYGTNPAVYEGSMLQFSLTNWFANTPLWTIKSLAVLPDGLDGDISAPTNTPADATLKDVLFALSVTEAETYLTQAEERAADAGPYWLRPGTHGDSATAWSVDEDGNTNQTLPSTTMANFRPAVWVDQSFDDGTNPPTEPSNPPTDPSTPPTDPPPTTPTIPDTGTQVADADIGAAITIEGIKYIKIAEQTINGEKYVQLLTWSDILSGSTIFWNTDNTRDYPNSYIGKSINAWFANLSMTGYIRTHAARPSAVRFGETDVSAATATLANSNTTLTAFAPSKQELINFAVSMGYSATDAGTRAAFAAIGWTGAPWLRTYASGQAGSGDLHVYKYNSSGFANATVTNRNVARYHATFWIKCVI